MKKTWLSILFILLAVFSFCQTIQKGNLLGLHIANPPLKEGVSMQDFVQFYTDKVVPEYEKAHPGIKLYLLKSLRGQDSSSLAILMMFNSEADRNNYFNNDGTPTARYNQVSTKLDDVYKELSDKYLKPVDNTTDKYTDWVVQ